MILLLTNKEDVTADLVVLDLQRRNIEFLRFNTEEFPQKVQIKIDYTKQFSGCFYFPQREKPVPFSSIRSVWYRRPTLPLPDERIPSKFRSFCIKESLQALEGIWSSLGCFWVSEPNNIRRAENKITQLKTALKLGFAVPRTIISNNPDEIMSFYKKSRGNIIIKPIRTGLIEDELVVFTSKILQNDIKNIQHAALLPSIYQGNLEKKFDIRITAVGDEVFPVEIHSQDFESSAIDWRRSQNIAIPHKVHKLPDDIRAKCLSLVRAFGLRFGAIDMVLTPKGEYYFLEINPNGQWAWIEKRTGLKLTKALTDLLIRGDESGNKS